MLEELCLWQEATMVYGCLYAQSSHWKAHGGFLCGAAMDLYFLHSLSLAQKCSSLQWWWHWHICSSFLVIFDPCEENFLHQQAFLPFTEEKRDKKSSNLTSTLVASNWYIIFHEGILDDFSHFMSHFVYVHHKTLAFVYITLWKNFILNHKKDMFFASMSQPLYMLKLGVWIGKVSV